MSGFGNLFGGLGDGLKKGLQYDAQFLSSFVWAVKGEHTQALTELTAIAEQNVHEMIDTTTGDVKSSVVGALIVGSDPFAGSRHAFQAWQTKYGKH